MVSRAYGPPSDYYVPTNTASIPRSSSIAKTSSTHLLIPQEQHQNLHLDDLAAQQLQCELNAYIADLTPQPLAPSLDQISKLREYPPTQKQTTAAPAQPPPHANAQKWSLGGCGGRVQSGDSSANPQHIHIIDVNNTTKTDDTTKTRLAALALQNQSLNPARALIIASCELDTAIPPRPTPSPNLQLSKTDFDFQADYVAFDDSDDEGDDDAMQIGVEREVFARLPRGLSYGDKNVRRAVARGREDDQGLLDRCVRYVGGRSRTIGT